LIGVLEQGHDRRVAAGLEALALSGLDELVQVLLGQDEDQVGADLRRLHPGHGVGHASSAEYHFQKA
jgi:hypothetical protein